MQNNTQFRRCLPRYRANRDAHLLMPPLRRMNVANGSAFVLRSAAYRSSHNHLERVRLRTILDTGDYMIGLSKGREMRAQWQRAAEIAACGRGHRRSASRLNLRCSTTPSLISLRWLDDPSFYVASKRAWSSRFNEPLRSVAADRAPTYPAAGLRRMLP
jgi:hypothetical protein